jgi:hypothetical protein
MDRDLVWDGCLNARDLGGLPTIDGATTRRGAVVRSDNPAFLTDAGWAALRTHGVRTILNLRTDGTTDPEVDETRRPADVTFRRVAVEDLTMPGFVERCVDTGLWCTPVHIGLMLEHWPERCAAAVTAVAEAPPGGVLIACTRGCDRTGLVAFLLLGLAGVAAADIAADWERSVERLRPRDPDQEAILTARLAQQGTTVRDAIEDALGAFDLAQRLVDHGLSFADLDAVRRRLVES